MVVPPEVFRVSDAVATDQRWIEFQHQVADGLLLLVLLFILGLVLMLGAEKIMAISKIRAATANLIANVGMFFVIGCVTWICFQYIQERVLVFKIESEHQVQQEA